MSIKDIGQKIKSFGVDKINPLIFRVKANFDIKEDIFIILAIILIGLAGFGLGRLSALEKGRDPVQILRPSIALSEGGKSTNNVPMSAAALVASDSAKGLLVASKSGKKYHFPWCAGASQIAEKNKIWFDSYEEAQKAGYTPASNCPGLK